MEPLGYAIQFHEGCPTDCLDYIIIEFAVSLHCLSVLWVYEPAETGYIHEAGERSSSEQIQ